jgi:hypothetical protein
MCGGIATKLNQIPKSELKKYYDDRQIAMFVSDGEFKSNYWDKRPILPIMRGDRVELKDWGNRDDKIDLPKTGWAKQESVGDGKWNWLNPESVNILADKGVEKGVWFNFDDHSMPGLLVKKGDEERVYMLTQPADQNYLEKTGHDRMPVGNKTL